MLSVCVSTSSFRSCVSWTSRHWKTRPPSACDVVSTADRFRSRNGATLRFPSGHQALCRQQLLGRTPIEIPKFSWRRDTAPTRYYVSAAERMICNLEHFVELPTGQYRWDATSLPAKCSPPTIGVLMALFLSAGHFRSPLANSQKKTAAASSYGICYRIIL